MFRTDNKLVLNIYYQEDDMIAEVIEPNLISQFKFDRYARFVNEDYELIDIFAGYGLERPEWIELVKIHANHYDAEINYICVDYNSTLDKLEVISQLHGKTYILHPQAVIDAIGNIVGYDWSDKYWRALANHTIKTSLEANRLYELHMLEILKEVGFKPITK